jgi:hypothetical protein
VFQLALLPMSHLPTLYYAAEPNKVRLALIIMRPLRGVPLPGGFPLSRPRPGRSAAFRMEDRNRAAREGRRGELSRASMLQSPKIHAKKFLFGPPIPPCIISLASFGLSWTA